MPAVQLESQPSTVTISKDVLSGRVEYRTERGGGVSLIEEHGGYFGRNTFESLSIVEGDPLSATSEMIVISKMGRDDWEVQVTATHKLTADADTFYLEADIKVTENGAMTLRKKLDTEDH